MPDPLSSPSNLIREVDWSGCLLTDRGSYDDIQALVGSEIMVMGERGIVEGIWMTEGTSPWPGPPWPRPVYRVRWSLSS